MALTALKKHKELATSNKELVDLHKKINILNEDIYSKSKIIDELSTKYSKIIDVEEEYKKIKIQLESDNYSILAKNKKIRDEIQLLKLECDNKRNKLNALRKTIKTFKDELDLIELGFYEPQFDFETSESFKEEIRACKERQKALLRDKSENGAIYADYNWYINGSKSEGKKQTNKTIRLIIRAFNNECDVIISSCTWKNFKQMKERIYQSSEYINSLNQVPYIEIRDIYIEEKIKELHLTYEYKVKKQKEKEEQAEIKAQMREEAKVEAEIKKAEAEALKEQKIYQKALDTARKELQLASDSARVKLEEKITELNIKISEIIEKHQRLKSMAEQTKQGHVYVISNIGSFGENVYKIGMTRRLEPNDRVSELGNASVPFVFDIHAMIHTNNAPELEKRLHDKFDNSRLNMKNKRKEFFNVELSEIKKAVTEYTSLDIEFIETAVAQDYYESQAIKKMISHH
ncbi:DUF4041 domain-containing protein [Francisella philomiragia]|nr:DUF4041 domain-containing protein [Francisella philomiragia]